MPKTCFPNLVQVAMVTMLLSMVFVEEIISGFTGSTPSCYYNPPYNCPSSKDGQKRQLRKVGLFSTSLSFVVARDDNLVSPIILVCVDSEFS